MPDSLAVAELGGSLVQGQLAESGGIAKQGQPVQDRQPGQHAVLQAEQSGHMGQPALITAQIHAAAHFSLDVLLPVVSQYGRSGNTIDHDVGSPG